MDSINGENKNWPRRCWSTATIPTFVLSWSWSMIFDRGREMLPSFSIANPWREVCVCDGRWWPKEEMGSCHRFVWGNENAMGFGGKRDVSQKLDESWS